MVLFFGPPGSGKSVQGQMLVQRNGWNWLSTGELFRRSTDPAVLKRLASGELIDDTTTNKVLAEELERLGHEVHIVLDGYPRNPQQAEWFLDYLAGDGFEIHVIIVFDVPEDELVRRLSGRGRDEDKPEVIKRRLQIYHEQTQPVLDFYEQQNVPVERVDGSGSVEEVHKRIQQVVERYDLVKQHD